MDIDALVIRVRQLEQGLMARVHQLEQDVANLKSGLMAPKDDASSKASPPAPKAKPATKDTKA